MKTVGGLNADFMVTWLCRNQILTQTSKILSLIYLYICVCVCFDYMFFGLMSVRLFLPFELCLSTSTQVI